MTEKTVRGTNRSLPGRARPCFIAVAAGLVANLVRVPTLPAGAQSISADEIAGAGSEVGSEAGSNSGSIDRADVVDARSAALDAANEGSVAVGSEDVGSSESSEPATGDARLLTFASTMEDGTLAPVGAVLYEPHESRTDEGERPMVVVAPGSVGAADRCAPSRTFMQEDDAHIG